LLQWRAEPKLPCKSRFGDLADNRYLPNSWGAVKATVEEAIERRKAALSGI